VGLQAGDPHLTTGSVALVWVATKTPRGKATPPVDALRAYRRKRRHRGDSRFDASSAPNHRITIRGSSLDKGERSDSIEAGNAPTALADE
jgi:hypothetical protein